MTPLTKNLIENVEALDKAFGKLWTSNPQNAYAIRVSDQSKTTLLISGDNFSDTQLGISARDATIRYKNAATALATDCKRAHKTIADLVARVEELTTTTPIELTPAETLVHLRKYADDYPVRGGLGGMISTLLADNERLRARVNDKKNTAPEEITADLDVKPAAARGLDPLVRNIRNCIENGHLYGASGFDWRAETMAALEELLDGVDKMRVQNGRMHAAIDVVRKAIAAPAKETTNGPPIDLLEQMVDTVKAHLMLGLSETQRAKATTCLSRIQEYAENIGKSEG